MSSAEAAANTPGRRPTARPMEAKCVPLASRFQEFDGQNTRAPSSDTTAGTSVSPASRVTATAIASAGPSDRSIPSEDSNRARKAMITAPAADAIASPTRVTALTIALLASSPARSRSR